MADVPGGVPAAEPADAGQGENLFDFRIVPRVAVPLAAAALAATVVAIAVDRVGFLEFLHVAAAAGWAAIALFLGIVVGPMVPRMEIPARVELIIRLMPKLLLLLPTLAVVTLAAGWQLGVHLGTVHAGYVHHGWMVTGYVLAGVTAVLTLGVQAPANLGVLRELKKMPFDPAVIERLMRRYFVVAGVSGGMLVASYVVMTKISTG